MKVKCKNLFFLLLIFPFFKPSAFVNYDTLDTVFDLWRIISIIFSVQMQIVEVISAKKFKYSKTQLILWFFAIYMLIVTICNSSSIIQWVLICLAPVCLISLIERWRRYDYEKCVLCIFYIFIVLIISNILVLFFKGDAGLYIDQYGSKVFLLGMRTRWPDVFFPFIGLTSIYLVLRRKKKKTKNIIDNFVIVAVAISILYQVIYMWIATAIFGLFLIGILFLICKLIKRNIDIIKLYWTSIIFNVLIIFFRIQNMFSWIITVVLHKDVGFNSRTMIWDTALEIIRKKWLFGYGISSNTSFVSLYNGKLIAQGHSVILQFLHDGGLIGLLLFLGSIFYFCKDIANKEFDLYISGVVVVISLFLGISEIYFYHIYIYVLIGLCTSNNFSRGRNNYESIINYNSYI